MQVGNLSPKELLQFNCCWMGMEALTLADIINGDGLSIQ